MEDGASIDAIKLNMGLSPSHGTDLEKNDRPRVDHKEDEGISIQSIIMVKMMGVLQLCASLRLGRGQMKDMVGMTVWSLIEEVGLVPPFDERLIPINCLMMNIIA